MIRNLQFQDLSTIIGYPRDFPFPDLGNGLYCIQKALLSGDRLVGAALLKLSCEAILITDPNLPSRTKARLIHESFVSLRDEAIKTYGLDQVHVFVTGNDEHYAQLLKDHFGFKDATGIPLVYTKEN